MEHHSLAALLRRSGPAQRRRTLLLFFCLRRAVIASPSTGRHINIRSTTEAADAERRSDEGTDDSGTDWGRRLSLDACVHMAYALTQFDRMPPRFVFAVGAGGSVLRSADRGQTWRRVIITRDDAAQPIVPSTGAEATGQYEGGGQVPRGGGTVSDDATSDAAQLRDILALLPQNSNTSTSGGKRHPLGAASAAVEGPDEGAGSSDSEESSSGGGEDPSPSGNLPSAARGQQSQCSSPMKPLTRCPDVFGVACHRDTVAVVGADCLIGISADRGATFSLCRPALLGAVRDRTKSRHEYATLRDVAFLDATTIVFRSSAAAVLSLSFSITGVAAVAMKEPVRVLLKSKRGPIGCVSVFPSHADPDAVLCVSTKGLLHVSADKGRSFTSIPHQLGLLRALAGIPSQLPATAMSDGSSASATRDSSSHAKAAPRAGSGCDTVPIALRHPNISEALTAIGLPKAAAPDAMMVAASLPHSGFVDGRSSGADERGTSTVTDTQAAAPAAKSFSYALSSSVATADATAAMELIHALKRLEGGVRTNCGDASSVYVRWIVLGTDGRIVPYDFTCVLHAWLRFDAPTATVLTHTTASQVDYMPFVQTLPSDAAGLAVQRVRDGHGGFVCIRSTNSGVSVSSDFGEQWTPPSRAFTGVVRCLDESSFVVAAARSCIVRSDDAGKTLQTIAIPAALRVPVVNDVEVME